MPTPKLDKGKGKGNEEPEFIEHNEGILSSFFLNHIPNYPYLPTASLQITPPLLDRGKAKELEVSDNKGVLLILFNVTCR